MDSNTTNADVFAFNPAELNQAFAPAQPMMPTLETVAPTTGLLLNPPATQADDVSDNSVSRFSSVGNSPSHNTGGSVNVATHNSIGIVTPPAEAVKRDDASTPSSTSDKDSGDDSDGVNIFINGLPPTMTEPQLTELMSQHGDVVSTKVMLHASTGVSRGFGFALFKSKAEGHNAIKNLNGTRLPEMTNPQTVLRLSISQHDGKVETSDSLFVRNIPISVSVDVAREFFAKFGTVLDVQLQSDWGVSTGRTGDDATAPPQPPRNNNNNNQQQQADVRYSSIAEAEAALKEIHGSTHFSTKLPILAKYAESEEARACRRQRRLEMRGQKQQQQASNKHQQQQQQRGANRQQQMPHMFAQQPMFMTPQGIPMQQAPPGMVPVMMAPQQQPQMMFAPQMVPAGQQPMFMMAPQQQPMMMVPQQQMQQQMFVAPPAFMPQPPQYQ